MDFHEVFSLKSTMFALVQLNETGLTQMTWQTQIQQWEI
jgi:hypothetical protein